MKPKLLLVLSVVVVLSACLIDVTGAALPTLAPASGADCNTTSDCTVSGAYCGYFQACKKCVCKSGHVLITNNGTDKCVKGGVALGGSCEDDAQCAAGSCSGSPEKCACGTGWEANADNTACQKPDAVGEACTSAKGCAGSLWCNVTGGNGVCAACGGQNCLTCFNDGSQCLSCPVGTYDATTGNCDACDALNCKTCDAAGNGSPCLTCADNHYVDDSGNCTVCTASTTCVTCNSNGTECATCATGKYLTNAGACSAQIAYNQACQGNAASGESECSPSGLQLTCSNSKCMCATNYTWNSEGSICVHSEANIAVALGGVCNADRDTVATYLPSNNDASAKVCASGLSCVPGCGAVASTSYCAKAHGAAGRSVMSAVVTIAAVAVALLFH